MFVGLVAAAMQKHYPGEKLPDCVKAARKVCLSRLGRATTGNRNE